MTKDEIKHINWMYNRLTSVHKESSNIDYMIRFKEIIDKQLTLCGVSNCNGVKDPNIVKTYALITRKDGLTDVWCEGKCLGEGLDTDGINKLNL